MRRFRHTFFRKLKYRLIIELTLSVLFFITMHSIVPVSIHPHYAIYALAFNCLLFISLSESMYAFNAILSSHFPWSEKILMRTVLLILFAFFYMSLFYNLMRHMCEFFFSGFEIRRDYYIVHQTLFLFLVILYIIILIIINWYDDVSKAKMENEYLKQEKLRSDYFALQQQVNPHFLFNSLSTLIAIIKTDQRLAVRFAENFSDTYRYILDIRNAEVATLQDEVAYLKTWLMLQKERHGDALIVDINIDENYNKLFTPPLGLQILVENCLKHNSCTAVNPLTIKVYVENMHVVVENNINFKKSTYSTNIGLDNLKKRYRTLAVGKEPVIAKTENRFIVKLPLLKMHRML